MTTTFNTETIKNLEELLMKCKEQRNFLKGQLKTLESGSNDANFAAGLLTAYDNVYNDLKRILRNP